jgi:pyrimidine deaminase RibD-like protein
MVEFRNNPTCHAEKIVIEKALKITGHRFLQDCDLWVTLEPCAMCAGMIKQTRIKRLYYGAEDKKGGAVDNGPRVFSSNQVKSSIEIYSGISSKISKDLLSGNLNFQSSEIIPISAGFIAAFLAGLVACKWMISLVKKSKLSYFSLYCAIVGSIAIGYALLN